MSAGPGLAVVDVETTGVLRGWHHRIVEVAIVGLDHDGHVTDRWCTLVNPQRDMGPQHIHGISAADAARAPVFSELVGEIIARMAGRVIVGHNLAFDLGHLAEEFERCGLPFDPHAVPTLCTMRLSHSYLPTGTGRSLPSICRALGLGLFPAHTAEGDAQATTAVLETFLARDPELLTPELVRQARAVPWPELAGGRVDPVRRRDPDDRSPHWLAGIVDRLPRVENPQVDGYLAALDRVVLDRYVDDHEADELIELAWASGLHRSDAVALHHGYLHAVAREALADRVVTLAERRDLARLAAVLGLPEEEVDRALADPQDLLTGFDPCDRLRLQAEMTVVITGDTELGKKRWGELLAEVAVTVAKNVTRATDLLVAADLDTASGKGREARARRVPIIDEAHLVELYQEVNTVATLS